MTPFEIVLMWIAFVAVCTIFTSFFLLVLFNEERCVRIGLIAGAILIVEIMIVIFKLLLRIS
jgi:hypothetical protein